MAVLGALTCAGLLGTGYFLQYFQGQDPCPLCLLQRGFYYGVLVVLAIGHGVFAELLVIGRFYA